MKRCKNAKKQFKNKSDIFIYRIYSSAIKPLSKLSVRVFEHKRIRQFTGLIVVISFALIAILPSSFAKAQTIVYQTEPQIQLQDAIKTEKSLRLPVDSFTVSQGYNFFHPGIDLAADKGSPVYPITDGKVIFVDHGRFGYGNHVIVDHGSGLKSLYAHFAKIEAKEGEKVSKNSIIGLVGSTGWSTGPHLHLQVLEENHWVNPRAFFEGYFGAKLASVR